MYLPTPTMVDFITHNPILHAPENILRRLFPTLALTKWTWKIFRRSPPCKYTVYIMANQKVCLSFLPELF